jgi:hypothetical protein
MIEGLKMAGLGKAEAKFQTQQFALLKDQEKRAQTR